MVSGLESIAMAVAHLERFQAQSREDGSPAMATPTTSSSPQCWTTAPGPVSFGSHQAVRFVSQEFESPTRGHSQDFPPHQQGVATPSPQNTTKTGIDTVVGKQQGDSITLSTPALGRSKLGGEQDGETPNSATAESLSPTCADSEKPAASAAPPQPAHKKMKMTAAAAAAQYEALKALNSPPVQAQLAPRGGTLPARRNSRPLKNLDAVYEPAELTSANAPPPPDTKQDIFTVNDDDVLCGRGGETNHHTGNIQYRSLVKACQPAYLAAKRRDKPRIAAGIVLAVRKIGGRFLKKEGQNVWRDVGNSRAREKTSQALREGAPEIRADTHPQPPSAVSLQAPSSQAPPASNPAPMLVSSSSNPSSSAPLFAPSSASPMLVTLPPGTLLCAAPFASAHGLNPGAMDTAFVMSNLLTQSLRNEIGFINANSNSHHQLHHHQLAPSLMIRPVPTVSGDDDDSSSSSGGKARGPRIKLLKRRLEDTSD